MKRVNIFWFRRDLRFQDNAALFYALNTGIPVVPIFVFDKNILGKLENRSDRRVEFIHATLEGMQSELIKAGSSLEVFHSTPEEAFTELLGKYNIEMVLANHDYEPYATERDASVAELLIKNNALFRTFKDHVILEKDEVIKDSGKPYLVFTPYSRKWKTTITPLHLQAFPSESYLANFYQQEPVVIPSLGSMGFIATGLPFPSKEIDEAVISGYGEQRDFPSVKGTSKLGIHLRFGTASIRSIARYAQIASSTYLNELIWRDFYQMILWHFPKVGKGMAFKSEYDSIEWRRDDGEFDLWCSGQTGYPIVDAGMRELNATGFMHNRVRMIVASFLCKHLLLDWRLGEAYFAEKLLDFDLAANNGGWQWASGSGCDSAPYFRIFNPYLQAKKFDPDNSYIKKWVPEFMESEYPKPIVEHEFARKRCLDVYTKALRKSQ